MPPSTDLLVSTTALNKAGEEAKALSIALMILNKQVLSKAVYKDLAVPVAEYLQQYQARIEEYYTALDKCATRYAIMAAQINPREVEFLEFVRLFCNQVTDRAPLLKLNRWLGYIQHGLIGYGLTTVQQERDFTRPLFRHLDFME